MLRLWNQRRGSDVRGTQSQRCLETAHGDIGGEKHQECPAIPPPNDSHRAHLRELRAGLMLTAALIERGAAALVDSVELLNRLDGRDGARPAPIDFTEGNSEPSR